jgi:hypothetical protein
MRKIRRKLKNLSEYLHFLIHITLGIVCGAAVYKIFTAQNIWILVLLGIIGNTLPDLDHIIYFFTYGKKTEYSTIVRQMLSDKQFKEIRKFFKENHKYLTGLYSHTLLSPLVTSLLSYNFYTRLQPQLLTLFSSFSIHFLYDIFEDLLFFGKLNKNWYLKLERN